MANRIGPLLSIRINNFRCIDRGETAFNRLSLMTAGNGAGKTTVLEAIGFALLQNNEKKGDVVVTIAKPDGSVSLFRRVTKDGKDAFDIDGRKCGHASYKRQLTALVAIPTKENFVLNRPTTQNSKCWGDLAKLTPKKLAEVLEKTIGSVQLRKKFEETKRMTKGRQPTQRVINEHNEAKEERRTAFQIQLALIQQSFQDVYRQIRTGNGEATLEVTNAGGPLPEVKMVLTRRGQKEMPRSLEHSQSYLLSMAMIIAINLHKNNHLVIFDDMHKTRMDFAKLQYFANRGLQIIGTTITEVGCEGVQMTDMPRRF